MIQSATKSDTAIRIRGLSKSYTIQKGGLEKQSTLAESALARLKNPLKRAEKETFHALKDIDLDIKKGEVVGIIGRNGAGKSTLLKVLSRITYPTTGQVDIYGRVGSLLEVGTGFHPELTGRENIYLNGAILGMTRPEITREFDAIVEFSGVEKFLDTPVKRYSSGMYVRLAFAVAAHLRTEILIVDEVLAVGDAEFQKKCLGKMKSVANTGRTVLFVSHNMATISQLTEKVAYLSKGTIRRIGTPEISIRAYLEDGAVASSLKANLCDLADNGCNILRCVEILPDGMPGRQLSMGDRFILDITYRATKRIENAQVGIGIYDSLGNRITSLSTVYAGSCGSVLYGEGVMRCNAGELPLNHGVYTIKLVLAAPLGCDLETYEDALTFEVEVKDVHGNGRIPNASQGNFWWSSSWDNYSTS